MRRSREQWAEIVGEFEGSGLSHEAFCAQQRLNVGSFRGWLYRLRNGLERGKVARSASTRLACVAGPGRRNRFPLASECVCKLTRGSWSRAWRQVKVQDPRVIVAG
jgi:hypothetical protein